jgi:hypothetical protein
MPLLVASLALAFLAACGGYPPHAAVPPAPASAPGVPGATTESIAKGHGLFVANCNKCHEHPDVASEPAEEWPAIVDRMGKKAEIEPADRESVLHFVLAARAQKLAK